MDGFKKRHNLVFRRICIESKKVDGAVSSQWMKDLQSVLKGYSHDDIFNVDKAGLFYKYLPNSMFIYRRCHEKTPMCQIMCFSLYCMNESIEGRRINLKKLQ